MTARAKLQSFEQAIPISNEPEPAAAPRTHIILPSGEVTITQCAAQIFNLIAPTKTMFIRGGAVTIIHRDDRGDFVLEILEPAAARSLFEKHGQIFAWRMGRNQKVVLQPAICPEQTAKAILVASEARDLLPKIRGLINCPFLKVKNGKLAVSKTGYDEETGILVTGGSTPPIIPLDEALDALTGLVAEFDFQSLGDKSRAIASFITPALKISKLIRGKVPADVAEADQSQSGKTYRQKLVAAIYNEKVTVVSQKVGGVGSIDETFSERLIQGRPFIQFDNFRGKLDSMHLEAFLTAEGSFPARVPHRSEVLIDPDQFFVLLSSNGVETTRDMANRSAIIRIRKREGYTYKNFPDGHLLDHVRAKQPYYLGCVFSVVREWFRRGCPTTDEVRHDFRSWCQSLDWILQNLFEAEPLMDGHDGARERVSNPSLTFVRKICLALTTNDYSWGDPLRATNLYEIAENAGIEVPGFKTESADADRAARAIGLIMARVFIKTDVVDLDDFRVKREQGLEYRDNDDRGGGYIVKNYHFYKCDR